MRHPMWGGKVKVGMISPHLRSCGLAHPGGGEVAADRTALLKAREESRDCQSGPSVQRELG